MKRLIKGKVVELVLGILLVVMTATGFATESVTYYHNDHLGSPVVATNSAGAVIWRESYQPYGQREIKQGDTQNSLWYTGKQEESAIGLSYYGARWYNPELGQFMSIDPVGVSPGSTYSFNRYAYANGNPYRFVDPDGRAPGDPFTHPVLAATDFGMIYNDDSIRNNVEYFAAIYSYTDSKGNTMYSYNVPNKGNGNSVLRDLTLEPNQSFVSTIHAHAAYDVKLDKTKSGGFDWNNRPSGNDRNLAGTNREYVITPDGSLIQFDNSMIRIIRTDMPSDVKDSGRKNNITNSQGIFGFLDDIHK